MRSVVMATYQGERYIARQLASILAKLAPDDEVVISDDSSSDSTLEVVEALADARIRALANPDRLGYVANFERAVAHARGDVVYFSDQDDVWLPSKVATLDAALSHHACVASDAIVVDDSLRTVHPSYFGWRSTKSFSAFAIYLKPPIVGATLACRRQYLQSLLPFPAGIPYDFWITVNAAWDGALHVTRVPLILYRRHPHALSVSATGRRRAPGTIAAERLAILASMVRRRWITRRPARRVTDDPPPGASCRRPRGSGDKPRPS